MTDIDSLIEVLRVRFPTLDVYKCPPGARGLGGSDQIWWFSLEGLSEHVQVEQGAGSPGDEMLPFTLEVNGMPHGGYAMSSKTLREAEMFIAGFLYGRNDGRTANVAD
jgi:hypothetical protein